MRHASRGRAIATAAALASAVTVGAGQAASFAPVHERARALIRDEQPAGAAKAYGAFAAAHASDPLAPLASILQGIVLRRDLSQGPGARTAFARALRAPKTPVGSQLRRVAQAWLARLQMDVIDGALRQYYVKHVWYPETLDELVAAKLLEAKALVDPWGKRFGYEVGRLKWAPKVPRQRYTLTCSAIEGDSKTLAKSILKRVDELGQRVRLRAIVPSRPRKAIVTTAKEPDKRVTVTAGSAIASAEVAFIAAGGVVLIDGEAVAFLTATR